MRIDFVKMQGLGNDFVVLDARETALPELSAAAVRRLADRHAGIGCDQLIRLEPSANADFRMRIFNRDGGEVEACGNAARAIAVLHGRPARVETDGGVIEVAPLEDPSGHKAARVTLDPPRFEWSAIPLGRAIDTRDMPLAWDGLENPSAVNVGNPHLVFFVEDCDAVPLETLGPVIERDPLFPAGINVNVATIEAPDAIRLRVWERGAGLTRACGTGACATAVAAARRGLCESQVTVALPGGELRIAWREDGAIDMTGEARESFRGSFEWDNFA